MHYNQRKKAIILLEDGTIFHGKSIGKEGSAFGEVCFNTGMTGYQEIFTDPSYFGQLMVCLLYTSPSPRDVEESRMPSSA